MLVLKSLSFSLDSPADDLFGYLQLCLLYVKPLLPSDDNCTYTWLHGFCSQILELVYFSHELLTQLAREEVVAAVVQTAMVVMSKHAGVNPIVLRRKFDVFNPNSVSNVTGVEVAAIEKHTKRVLKHVLGEHIYNQFKF